MKPEDMKISGAWENLDLENWAGTVLVVGATDTGKSTLVRYLVDRICRRGRRVGWLDGDIGQSTLGLPGTQNLALVDDPGDDYPPTDGAFFVGSASPRGHMLPVMTGLAHLQKRAEGAGAAVTIVDTTGLVALETGGGALKQWMAELLSPAVIVALQRGDELEHLLASWRRDGRFALHDLPVVEAVRQRSREERSAYRRRQFRRYFRTAGLQDIVPDSVAIYGEEQLQPGTLVGLQNGRGRTLALGTLQQRFSGLLRIVTPLTGVAAVQSIRCGSLRLDPQSGEELPG